MEQIRHIIDQKFPVFLQIDTIPATTTPSRPGNPTGNSIAIDKTTFGQLVNKSSQWDVIAGTLAIDKNDATGGQKASQRFQQLEQDINNVQLQRDDVTNTLNHMQGGYNSLQMQYTSLQAQYSSLQQDYMALQQNSGVPSDAMIALQKNMMMQ